MRETMGQIDSSTIMAHMEYDHADDFPLASIISHKVKDRIDRDQAKIDSAVSISPDERIGFYKLTP